jgi:hypothetical protein
MTLRATVEDPGESSEYPIRLYLWKYDEETEITTLLELAEAPSIVKAIYLLGIESDPIEVQMPDGSWEIPDAITTAEALECTL